MPAFPMLLIGWRMIWKSKFSFRRRISRLEMRSPTATSPIEASRTTTSSSRSKWTCKPVGELYALQVYTQLHFDLKNLRITATIWILDRYGFQMVDLCQVGKWSGIQMVVWKPTWWKSLLMVQNVRYSNGLPSHVTTIWIVDTHTVWHSGVQNSDG